MERGEAGDRDAQAVRRIENALERIARCATGLASSPAASPAPAPDNSKLDELSARHESLRAEVEGAISAIDAMLKGGSR
jgi:hypothetical protein